MDEIKFKAVSKNLDGSTSISEVTMNSSNEVSYENSSTPIPPIDPSSLPTLTEERYDCEGTDDPIDFSSKGQFTATNIYNNAGQSDILITLPSFVKFVRVFDDGNIYGLYRQNEADPLVIVLHASPFVENGEQGWICNVIIYNDTADIVVEDLN